MAEQLPAFVAENFAKKDKLAAVRLKHLFQNRLRHTTSAIVFDDQKLAAQALHLPHYPWDNHLQG